MAELFSLRLPDYVMATRKLTKNEIEQLFQPLYECVSRRLGELVQGDSELLFALRRKLAKSLIYDERGTPMHRRRIKTLKREEQQGHSVPSVASLCHNAEPFWTDLRR